MPLLGVDLEVARWDGDVTMTVTPAHVITTALVAALAAWVALAVLETVARRATRRIWTGGALIVLVASLVMPVTAARTTAAVVALELMHVAVGAALITALPARARGASSPRPSSLTLNSDRRLGRVATVGADGTPHVTPVGWTYVPGAEVIEVTGHQFATTKKYRDVSRTGRAAIVIDDVLPPWQPRGCWSVECPA